MSQVEVTRALAERPLRVQGSVKINKVYDVNVTELPVRILGDCLRGSAALCRDLPHNPAVRAQAALAIAQWQNNKSPSSKDAVGEGSWIGLDLLLQYFKERFMSDGTIIPVKYTRVSVKTEPLQTQEEISTNGTTPENDEYQYLDTYTDKTDRANVIEEAVDIHNEEDEEYRVRSAVITAIASCRAKDGLTPPVVLQFFIKILQSGEDCATVNLGSLEEINLIRKKRQYKHESVDAGIDNSIYVTLNEGEILQDVNELPFASARLIADSLLSLCHINSESTNSDINHPCMPLIEACHRWLLWDLCKEDIRAESEMQSMTGLGCRCYSSISASAIIALYSLGLLRQCTTILQTTEPSHSKRKKDIVPNAMENAISVKFYMEIFDYRRARSDITRAAAAQAVTCLFCAVDRVEEEKKKEPTGLLNALEFLLEGILGKYA